MPTMTPNKPSALPKISTTKILTKSVGFCASDSAHELPTTPTQMPHTKLASPTVRPDAKIAYLKLWFASVGLRVYDVGFKVLGVRFGV